MPLLEQGDHSNQTVLQIDPRYSALAYVMLRGCNAHVASLPLGSANVLPMPDRIF